MTLRLSACREDTEPYRIARLAELVAKLSPDLLPSIAELHDHKGYLTVTWCVPMCVRCMHEVDAAWAPLDASGAGNVEHVEQGGVP